MPGKCAFQPLWLSEDHALAKWLRPVEANKQRAFCNLCKREFDISHSGINSVRLHQKGQRHSTLEDGIRKCTQTRLNFGIASKQNSDTLPEAAQVINLSPSTTECPNSSSAVFPTVQVSPNTITSGLGPQSSFLSSDITKSEILWAMGKVVFHSSDRSFSAVSELFPRMFPDSFIASKFKMQKDKLGYVITYGLGPYFENVLVKTLKKCEYFCVSFDESLNKVAQMGQMDVVVRFWNSIENKVHTQYLTSVFLKRSRAVDLLEGFSKAMSDFGLPLANICQIALDGPNVNLKFLEDFKYLMREDNCQTQEILDTGTCSLHVINNAYKTAHKKTEWDISSFLRSLYFLFKDFPSRRAKFREVSGTNIFPLKLCTIRWTENSKVLARAISMVPSLKLFIENVKNDPPDSKNFQVLQKFLKDNTLIAKLHFLQSVIIELEPFLTRFQSNKPLIPFLYGEVFSMSYSIASRFIKKNIMAQIGSGRKLQSVEYKTALMHLPLQAIDVGFGARAEYRRMSDAEKTTFQSGCKVFLMHIFEKLAVNYKSPLSNCLVKGLSCLSPDVMKKQAVRGERISLALKEFVKKKHLAPIEADIIKRKYLEICERSTFQSELQHFNEKRDRLDEFFMQHLNEDEDARFLKFVKRCLSLFHGNAEVERGFSVNKECLVENLQEHSLIAQRCIYSSVIAAGGLKNIEISNSMVSSVLQASRRRRDALTAKETEKSQRDKTVKELSEKIKILEDRKRKLQQESNAEMSALVSELNEAKTKKLKLSDLC